MFVFNEDIFVFKMSCIKEIKEMYLEKNVRIIPIKRIEKAM